MGTDLRSIFRGGLLIMMIGGACATKPPPDPDGVRGQAVEILVGMREIDSLDCRSGDCTDWYRFRVEEEGTLYLTGRSTQRDDTKQRFSIHLEDGFGRALESLREVGAEEQTLTRRLDEGVYLIGLESTRGDGSIIYELASEFEVESEIPRPRRSRDPDVSQPVIEEPPAEPTYSRVDAEVLEVEGSMAEPTGVLIGLGQALGAFAGQRGELLEGDSLVGEIEIVEIYEEGSRARLSAPLFRPITPAVRAVLFFPEFAGEAEGDPMSNEPMDEVPLY